MIIIGEKINGAIPGTAEAIKTRDENYIQMLVRIQEENGADYLDVCAGTTPELEYDALCWLIDVVQRTARKPICIDSPDPEMLEKVLDRIEKPGILNSVSLEGNKCQILLPLLSAHPEWQAIMLACDQNGIAEKAEKKADIAFALIEGAEEYGIAPNRLHIDPLVLALSAVGNSAMEFTKAIRLIKEKYPDVKVTAALSNISYGMPVRRIINTNFLVLAMEAGLDSVITDPVNRPVTETIYGVEALLNRDRYCRKYNKAYREKKIGPVSGQ